MGALLRGKARLRLRPWVGEGGRLPFSGLRSRASAGGLWLLLLKKRGSLAFPSPKPEGPSPLPWAGVSVHACGGKGVNQAGSRCCI